MAAKVASSSATNGSPKNSKTGATPANAGTTPADGVQNDEH